MSRHLASAFGLIAGLAPAMALAQTNIDQGKSPAQIFATDCAACHKAARGLANGRNSAALADFLREHYTTSGEQAAALAAYVLGAGGGQSGEGRAQKPTPEHASVSAEEPKPAANHQKRRSGKPQAAAPASGKPQRPAGEEAKPEEESISVEEPSPSRPTHAVTERRRHRPAPAKAARGRREEPETTPAPQQPAAVAPEPAAAVAEPPATEAPSTPPPNQEASPAPSAAAPSDAASGDNSPVPRDNIPD